MTSKFSSPERPSVIWSSRSLHGALLILFLLSTIVTSGSIFSVKAQPQVAPKPSATPKPAPAPKPVSGESPKTEFTTGTIEGRVVSDEGRPVANARVIAQSNLNKNAPRIMNVDSDGRFLFDGLSKAAYVITAFAPGYIDQALSFGDPNQWPRHLIGSQVKITMIKGGVVTGTVTNASGDPIVGVPVSASPLNGLSVSNLSMMGIGAVAETDDRGIYRIYGLQPGQYVVSAGGGGPFGQFNSSGFDLDVPTFYPSTTRDAAVPVMVRSGDETTGIDIKYRGADGHSISGFVTGNIEPKETVGAVSVLLSHADSTSILSMALAFTVDQRRVFSFNAVADGEYELVASYQSRPNDNPLIGTKRVTVRGGDVTGIEVRLGALATIDGTMTLDPIKPEEKCDKRVSEIIETVITTTNDESKKTIGQSMLSLFSGASGTLDANGEFTILNLEPSKYRLGITLPTDAWYIRAIIPPAPPAQKGSQPSALSARPGDAWRGVVTVKSGERVGPFKIMIGQDAAGLSGRIVAKPESTIPAGLHVYLVPAERDHADNILRYGEMLVSRDGSFAFKNLAPGRYLIYTRIEPASETQTLTSTPPRPLAWDNAARLKLRREAEAANNAVELKPCQRLVDYAIPL